MNQKIHDFIGTEAVFDHCGQYIQGLDYRGAHTIAEVRGWGEIQKLFTDEHGKVDFESAEKFQESIGLWISEAITEKLERERQQLGI